MVVVVLCVSCNLRHY